MKRKITLLVAALAMALTATGCSTASTASDEVAVHKGGGPLEGKTDKGCIPVSTREYENTPGDTYFYYPANQRTYDFNGGDNSDAGPITSVSKDNQPVSIPGQINFELVTDCKVLTAFHDNIGNRLGAYLDEGETTSAGWRKMMSLYIGRAAETTMDRVARGYTWKELYSDPAVKDKMQTEVNKTIRTLVNQQTDGNQEFFTAYSALIKQPVPPQELLDALKAEEASKAQAAAALTKAQADAAAAAEGANAQVAQKRAELTVAQLEAKIKKAEIGAYGGIQNYNDAKAIEKGLNPFQPTYGGSTLTEVKP